MLILFPLIGIGLGAGQWFALRNYFSGAGWWVLATGLGWLLGLSVDFTFQQLFATSAWQGFALAGLYQAALQWLILRRRGWVAIVWLPACAAAWTAAGIAYHLPQPAAQPDCRFRVGCAGGVGDHLGRRGAGICPAHRAGDPAPGAQRRLFDRPTG